jgi:hypothetical protein
VTSDDKTDTYDETVSRTTSEPTADVTVTEETSITAVPARKVETYEVQSETATSDEESVSSKARDAGKSLKDLIYSLGRKTKEVTEEKARELKAQSDVSTKTDARDIQHLGEDVEKLITVFEDTMTEIRNEAYDEQEKLLVGYRKLLEEQINVINAKRRRRRKKRRSSILPLFYSTNSLLAISFTTTDFTLTNSLMPNSESSLPIPDFLTPPNGRRGSDFTISFTDTIPLST